MVEVGHALQGRPQARRQKRSHYAEPNETDADEKTRLERFRELDADERSENCEDDGHHNCRAKTDYVSKDLFHAAIIP